MKKYRFFLLALLLLLCMTCTAGCQSAHEDAPSPETALHELQEAVKQRDVQKISSYVDLEQFLENTYDISAREMSTRIDVLAKRYPEDPFFWHTTEFMQQYAAEHRDISLHFIHDILAYYFANEAPAVSYDSNPTSWLSGELAKLHAASTAEWKEFRKLDKQHTIAVLRLKGDGSPYGNLTDGITLELGMEQQADGRWKFTGIENIPELILPVADKAEMFWTLQGWQ